jgi:hypothetical protein
MLIIQCYRWGIRAADFQEYRLRSLLFRLLRSLDQKGRSDAASSRRRPHTQGQNLRFVTRQPNEDEAIVSNQGKCGGIFEQRSERFRAPRFGETFRMQARQKSRVSCLCE